MKYSGICILVEDMPRAKRFYTEALGQSIAMDMGENVTFMGGFSLQSDYERLMGISKSDVTQRSNSFELYFEEDDLDSVIARLKEYGGVRFTHEKREAPWGQFSTVFYDPDGHLIEVGETMTSLVRRMTAQGLTPEQVSEQTGMPIAEVQRLLG